MRRVIGDAMSVLAGLAAGCLIIVGAIWALLYCIDFGTGDAVGVPTITADEARDRMDTLLRQAVATMGSAVSLTQTKTEVTSWNCSYGWQGGDGPTGEVEVQLDYLLDGVTPDRQAEVISAMGSVGPTIPDGDYFQTVADRDGHDSYKYMFRLKRESDQQMSIHAQSDCLWRHGTPEVRPRLGSTTK
ncbi:hypothetical protein [Nocardia heshunensis]